MGTSIYRTELRTNPAIAERVTVVIRAILAGDAAAGTSKAARTALAIMAAKRKAGVAMAPTLTNTVAQLAAAIMDQDCTALSTHMGIAATSRVRAKSAQGYVSMRPATYVGQVTDANGETFAQYSGVRF